MKQERLEQLRKNLIATLALNETEQLALDESLNSISTGLPVIVLVVLIAAAVYLANIGWLIGSIILGLIIFGHCVVKFNCNENQLQVFANIIGERFYKNKCIKLHSQLLDLPLPSLKGISCDISAYIIFAEENNVAFLFSSESYNSGAPSNRFGKEITRRSSWKIKRIEDVNKIERSDAWEICPGILLKVTACNIRCKCDFRIVRTEMAPHLVGWLFRLVTDAIPELSMDDISVRQYSSTKNFLFRREYLDSGTISYISSKGSNRNKSGRSISAASGVNRNTSRSFANVSNSNDLDHKKGAGADNLCASVNSTNQYVASTSNSEIPTDIELNKRTNDGKSVVTSSKVAMGKKQSKSLFKVNAIPLRSIIGQTTMLISQIIERRKEVELLAMRTVIQYEKTQGRTPEDVSKQNLGFDILSRSMENQERKIEVKGFKTTGTVLLTENERTVACNADSTYYLYIVENCLASEKTRIIIRQNIKPSELEEQASKYLISAERLERVGQYADLS